MDIVCLYIEYLYSDGQGPTCTSLPALALQSDMSRALPRAVFTVVLPGLVAGGLCGAAVGIGLVPPVVGVACAVLCGLYIGYAVWRTRRRFIESDR